MTDGGDFGKPAQDLIKKWEYKGTFTLSIIGNSGIFWNSLFIVYIDYINATYLHDVDGKKNGIIQIYHVNKSFFVNLHGTPDGKQSKV